MHFMLCFTGRTLQNSYIEMIVMFLYHNTTYTCNDCVDIFRSFACHQKHCTQYQFSGSCPSKSTHPPVEPLITQITANTLVTCISDVFFIFTHFLAYSTQVHWTTFSFLPFPQCLPSFQCGWFSCACACLSTCYQ